MQHCIIWAVPRVGSTALAQALGAVSEPFQRDHYRDVNPEIEKLCASRQSIKHLYEECPSDTNIALAWAADRHGYRHIHLVRLNEFARLVSRGIAQQLDAWIPETAAAKFRDLKTGRAKLRPLDISHLLKMRRMARERWASVHPYIKGPVLWVRFEDITNKNCQHRRAEFCRIASYLCLPPSQLKELDRAMVAGEQHTREVWEFAPNLGELRQALMTP